MCSCNICDFFVLLGSPHHLVNITTPPPTIPTVAISIKPGKTKLSIQLFLDYLSNGSITTNVETECNRYIKKCRFSKQKRKYYDQLVKSVFGMCLCFCL